MKEVFITSEKYPLFNGTYSLFFTPLSSLSTLKQEKIAIIGMGEVGTALYTIFKNHYGKENILTIDYNPEKQKNLSLTDIDIMHICFPYSKSFIDETAKYIEKYKPKYVVINSTVQIGTTRKIQNIFNFTKIVHSPVRGQHNNLVNDILRYTKWIGYIDLEACKYIAKHFLNNGIMVKAVKNPETTEALKLLDTTQYGAIIAYMQEANRILEKFNIDYNLLNDFFEETLLFYNKRVKAYPGVIGGKCVIPNIKILQEMFNDNKMLKWIIESNEKRKKELIE